MTVHRRSQNRRHHQRIHLLEIHIHREEIDSPIGSWSRCPRSIMPVIDASCVKPDIYADIRREERRRWQCSRQWAKLMSGHRRLCRF